MGRYKDLCTYDRTKDKTIDICLNCKKKTCDGNCKLKRKGDKKCVNLSSY